MARIITCDICGAPIAHNNMDSYLDLPDEASTLRIKSKRETSEISYNGECNVACTPDLTYEICPNCTQRVMDFVKDLIKEVRFGSENGSHGVSYQV